MIGQKSYHGLNAEPRIGAGVRPPELQNAEWLYWIFCTMTPKLPTQALTGTNKLFTYFQAIFIQTS